MRNSTIKIKTGQCLDCPPGKVSFLTADRCQIHYAKHRAEVCAARKAKRSDASPAVIKSVELKVSKPRQTELSKRSLQALLDLAQIEFNRFIRLRDAKENCFICISCQGIKVLDQMNAGHYYSMGNHSYLRFNENNVHGQCIQCNNYMSGHLINYRENLIKKIGIEEVEKLDTWRNFSQKWDKAQAIAIIQLYKEKSKAFL